MAVVCAACKTENRDNAKFCHGCAGKLPAFAATGPSALETMKTWRPPNSQASAAGRLARESPALLPGETAAFWVRVGLMVLACGIALVGWHAYVTRKFTPPAAMTSAIAAPPPPQRLGRVDPPAKPVSPVPLVSSLSLGELAVAPGPVPVQAVQAPPPPLIELKPEPQIARVQPPRTPSRVVALDPRQGCDKLNFFSAARCEAAHCDQPQYTRHPRCDAVREDRRRDYARRNPTLGF